MCTARLHTGSGRARRMQDSSCWHAASPPHHCWLRTRYKSRMRRLLPAPSNLNEPLPEWGKPQAAHRVLLEAHHERALASEALADLRSAMEALQREVRRAQLLR